MKSRVILLITGLLLLTILFPGTASAKPPRYMDVESITMTLEGPDATFHIKYKLDLIAKMYILLLGTGSMEPAVLDLFNDFENVEVLSIREDYAVVKTRNVSYRNTEQGGNMFFHESHNLGTTIETFTIVFPSGVKRTFSDVTNTQNTFFEA